MIKWIYGSNRSAVLSFKTSDQDVELGDKLSNLMTTTLIKHKKGDRYSSVSAV